MTPDPDRIRRLADSGDPFWKGAAWMLDQIRAQEPQNSPQR